MKNLALLILSLVLAGAAGAGLYAATMQDDSMGGFQPPKPNEHHKSLTDMEGTWETNMKMWMMPGAPPMEIKGGKTVYRKGPGGFWLIGDHESNFMGSPYKGHEVAGYDQMTGKHVSIWLDSMTSTMSRGEGTCKDKCTKEEGTIQSIGMDGKPETIRYTADHPDKDNISFSMYKKGPDGKEFKAMEMVYTRKK